MIPTRFILCAAFGLVSGPAQASAARGNHLDLAASPVGYAGLAIFVVVYLLVIFEEFTGLRKSKPVVLAAGVIWGMIAFVADGASSSTAIQQAIRRDLLEYAELLLFLVVAMTYINAMDERLVFEALRSWLVRKGFTYRSFFWVTGWLAFLLSPLADNLTTALLMCAVIMAVEQDNRRFIAVSCVNIVVAANAGGAFSPFGDITTLMVWQKGMVEFWAFFQLFVPSLVNFILPAMVMSLVVPAGKPGAVEEAVHVKRGASVVVMLFLLTIVTAVTCHNLLHLPPALGMMTGLGYLQLFGFYLWKIQKKGWDDTAPEGGNMMGDVVSFDVFRHVARAEWDTLLFFYGVVMCVGGLGFMGYLVVASHALYIQWGATYANVAVGLLSAIVDNIPVMFAVLSMDPEMPVGQWLLVTLTAGVGGSLLSIGSAAGVALMGQARGQYTFFAHLKWTPVIALGYGASILVHMWLNGQSAA